MAKVLFKRYETDLEAQESDVVDGQFIVTKDGTSYIDYGNERIPFGGTPDTQMSDTSQNAVQNKVIKEYVDGALETQNVYSTTETVIGTWLGKPLYRKLVNMGNLPDNYYKDVNHNISNLEEVANVYLRAKTSNDLYYMSNMKGVSTMFGEGTGIVARADATKIQVATNSDYSTHTAYAIIEYTKTTD